MNERDAPSIQRAREQVAAAKRELRGAMRAALRGLAPAAQRAAGEALTSALLDRLVGASARGPVALFASMPHELDTTPLDRALRARGVARAYPTVQDGALVFRLVNDVGALPRGALGIPSPPPSCPDVALAACGAVVVPGLAFDGAGRRLGHGKGYYDRALAPALLAGGPELIVGVGLDAQQVAAVPVDAHDVALPFTWSPAQGLLDHRRSFG